MLVEVSPATLQEKRILKDLKNAKSLAKRTRKDLEDEV
jgi:hypothetical protein